MSVLERGPRPRRNTIGRFLRRLPAALGLSTVIGLGLALVQGVREARLAAQRSTVL